MFSFPRSNPLTATICITAFLLLSHPLFSQNNDKSKTGETDNIQEFMEQGMKEIDYYSLEELLNVEVEIASLFAEDELVVGSTVSSISSHQWRSRGAKRLNEAFENEMSVVSYPSIFGTYMTAIRGYAQVSTDKGVSMLIDGVPTTDLVSGSPIYSNPNWELGTLDKIEMIKGPGSAIYGSDAFHGVLSLKTFESDKNHYSIEGAGAYPLYGDGNLKISQGIADDLIRIDAAAGASYQGAQDLEYTYNDPIGYHEPAVAGQPGLDVEPASGKSSRDFKYSSQTGVLKVKVKPSEKFNIKAGAYLNRGNYDEYPALVAVMNPYSVVGGVFNTQDNDLSWSDTMFLMTNGSMNYMFNNKISVEASGYYWQCDKEYTAATTSTYNILNITKDKSNQYSGQVLIKQPDNAINLQWLLAYSYTKSDIVSSKVHNTAELFGQTITVKKYPSLFDGMSRDIHSIFGQIKWGAIKNKLYLLLGGRDDIYSDFGNQFTPRGGLIYLPTQQSSIKALYGRAFRATCAGEQTGKEAYVKGDKDLKPEIIDIYELIYMYKEKKWKASINAFYSKWKNGIIMEIAPADVQAEGFKKQYVNKGKNDSIGGEANLFYTLDPFAVDLGFSYVKSREMNVEDPEDPGKTENRYYTAFPEYSINTGLYYTLKAIDTNFNLNNRIYLNMTEAPESAKADPDKLPAYYRLDLNVSKVIAESLELYLNVRNLLNRENRLPSMVGSEDGYVEPGIGVMLRASYKI